MKGPTRAQPPTLQAKMKLEFSFSCKVGALDLTDKDGEVQTRAFSFNEKIMFAHLYNEGQQISFIIYTTFMTICLFLVPPVVEVLEPPFNSPLQERVANQRIAFPCPAKGQMTCFLNVLPNPKCFTMSPGSFRSP